MKESTMIEKLSEIRITLRNEIHKNKFSVPARFSGGMCLCGRPIQIGERITRLPYSPWMHLECAELDGSDSRIPSKASQLTDKIAEQAIKKQAVWRDDLLELAKSTFLGQWSKDYWLEDLEITFRILDLFGLHKLTKGWRYHSDKARQKYASKIEREFARRKGWICRVCKRLIWVEKSVERAIGPVCYKKHKGSEK